MALLSSTPELARTMYLYSAVVSPSCQYAATGNEYLRAENCEKAAGVSATAPAASRYFLRHLLVYGCLLRTLPWRPVRLCPLLDCCRVPFHRPEFTGKPCTCCFMFMALVCSQQADAAGPGRSIPTHLPPACLGCRCSPLLSIQEHPRAQLFVQKA